MENPPARLGQAGLVLIAVGCSRTSEATPDAAPAASSAPAAAVSASAPAAASAAPAAEIASGARFEEATQGAPFDISLHKRSVIYCDRNSKHALKLWPNNAMAVDGFCRPARAPNTSCAGVAGVKSVRAQGGGPDDVLETANAS